MSVPSPYLLFLGDITEPAYAKTAFGLRDWARERCVGEYALESATISTGLPQMTPDVAALSGAQAMVIGVANPGGCIPATWLPGLMAGLRAGLDLVAGMHVPLAALESLQHAAAAHGRALIDVRIPPPGIPLANGRKRGGKRLLTVGTDCALGKKYTALALTRSFRERGIDADFRASGQTGILIAGSGIAMDAVVADFAAGAAELLSPEAAATHWDVIEGQGSLAHPAYAGVSLALLHGSQPDVIVVCHAHERRRMIGFSDFALPSIEDTIALAMRLGARTNPAIRCAGVSLNTAGLDDFTAQQLMAQMSASLRLPVADPMRGGDAFAALVQECLG